MTSATHALVRLTMPQQNPNDDTASISLAYKANGLDTSSDVGLLVDQVPHLITQVATGAGHAIGTWLAPSFSRTANICRVDVYDVGAHLDGSPHGSPVASGTWTMPAALGTDGLPAGLAAALSFRADYGTDVEFSGPRAEGAGGTRPRARDRGRFYLGPLVPQAITTAPSDGHVTFGSVFIDDCLADLQQVVTISETIPPDSWGLAVWSRRNASMKLVTELWMDDRPDYQRRRSDPGTKTFRSAT